MVEGSAPTFVSGCASNRPLLCTSTSDAASAVLDHDATSIVATATFTGHARCSGCSRVRANQNFRRRRALFKTCNSCADASLRLRRRRRPFGPARTLARRLCARAVEQSPALAMPLLSMLASQCFRCCHCHCPMACSGAQGFTFAAKASNGAGTNTEEQVSVAVTATSSGATDGPDFAVCCVKCLRLRDDDYSFEEFTELQTEEASPLSPPPPSAWSSSPSPPSSPEGCVLSSASPTSPSTDEAW